MKLQPAIEKIENILKNNDKKYVLPIWTEIIADLETPVSAFYKVCKDKKHCFLLESADKGESFGRYSIIGADPHCILKSDLNKTLIFEKETNNIIKEGSNPFDVLQDFLGEYDIIETDLDYSAGAVGYFGYDSIRHIEEKINDVFKNIEGCESFPEAYFMIAGTVLVFDHLSHKIYIINNVLADKDTDLKAVYKDTQDKIEQIIKKLSESHNLNPLDLSGENQNVEITSNFTKDQWTYAINRAKEHIIKGDIFQVVLSQRFCVQDPKLKPFDVYRALRSINPSPYMYYLNYDDFKIIGSSPEIMVKCSSEGEAFIRPIAGTRQRGFTREEDVALEYELLNDPKERAEHVMLVDLARNDFGRVCNYGSVKVNDPLHVEKYSHVQHIVSDVIGDLQPDKTSIDLVKATFPAGTLSGAPKVKAMEIIYNLEKAARGPYGGCIGHFGFNNEINTAITIRTILNRGDKYFIQAGAGIVADSDPEFEYQETQNKAAALVQTIKKLG